MKRPSHPMPAGMDLPDRGASRATVMAGCILSIMAGAPAEALELGEPDVRSHLGQRLEVVVPYRTGANERLVADCVSLVRGEDSGLPVILAARVISAADGRLSIRSSQPIREPLLAMHVKVDCPASPFLVRSYAIIIDPAESQPTRPVPVMVSREPAAGAGPETGPGQRQESPYLSASPAQAGAASLNDARPTASRKTTAPPTSLAPGTTYRVRAGDTLYRIASRVSGRTTGVWPTARRLFAANPEAFVDGDMDRLLAGSVLTITDTGVTAAPVVPPQARDSESKRAHAVVPPAPEPEPADIARETSAGVSTSVPWSGSDVTSTAMDSAADGSGAPADPVASPFKVGEAIERETVPGIATARTTAPVSAGDDATIEDTRAGAWSISPTSGAMLGVGLGLLLALAMFRPAIRDLFRRRPSPAAAEEDTVTAPALSAEDEAAGFFAEIAAAPDETPFDDEPAPMEADPDVLVAEETWSHIDQSRLRSLDLDLELDFEADDDESIDVTAEEPVATQPWPGDEEDTVEPLQAIRERAEATPEERFEESMIVEVDTGAELAAGRNGDDERDGEETREDTGLATAVDLKMLEEDYEQEFTATQRLEKQLADAALELDREIAEHARDDEADDMRQEPLAATAEKRSA